MPSDSTTWAAYTRAQAELAHHPSVRSVELGWKVSRGQLQPTLAIRVYVDRKLPLDQVPADLRIPPRIAGLPTDVLMVSETRLLGHDMIGGDKVTRIVWNEDGSGSGTLAYIATRVADSKRVMLSNQHVFRNDLGNPARMRELFQPDISCRALGSKCNYVGFAVDGQIGDFVWSPDASPPQPHFVDCAIGEIDDADSQRGVKEFPSISGSEDITQTPTNSDGTPIEVKKTGARTGHTTGVVVSVNSTGHQKVGPFEIQDQPLTILIRTTQGQPFAAEHEVPAAQKASIIQNFNAAGGPGTVTDLGANRLRFAMQLFSDEGDSGSAIVRAGKIVGLLYGGTIFTFPGSDGETHWVPLGETRACHIGPVMARLGIRIDPSTMTSAGETTDVAWTEARPRDAIGERLATLEQELMATARGRMLRSLVREHGPEMVDLVHHRRRVTVCWHRHQGPAFAALIAKAVREPEHAIPAEHGGITLTRLLSAMHDVLVAEGSAVLGTALRQNRAWVLEWTSAHDRVPDLLSALSRDEPRVVVDAACD